MMLEQMVIYRKFLMTRQLKGMEMLQLTVVVLMSETKGTPIQLHLST